MEVNENEIINCRVPEGTTHLMIWVGGMLPEDVKVRIGEKIKNYQYENKDKRDIDTTSVNYVKTLKGECEKMAKNGEACILVYDSKLINDKDKDKLKNIVNNISNCYLVDFEEFIKDEKSEFKTHLDAIINANIKEIKKKPIEQSPDAIGNVVDCMRVALLQKPSKLKQLAIKNNPNNKKIEPKTDDFTLLYHDFDIVKITEGSIKKKVIDVKENPLLFCKPMGNAETTTRLENGLLFANSENDENEAIQNLIENYMTKIKGNDYKMIYSCCPAQYIKGNDFSQQYQDEHHESWLSERDQIVLKATNLRLNILEFVDHNKLKNNEDIIAEYEEINDNLNDDIDYAQSRARIIYTKLLTDEQRADFYDKYYKPNNNDKVQFSCYCEKSCDVKK